LAALAGKNETKQGKAIGKHAINGAGVARDRKMVMKPVSRRRASH
jgi:hypothetical protein